MYDEELRLSVPTKPSTSHEGRSSRGHKGRKSPRYNKNLNRIPVGPNITCSIENCKNYGKYKCDLDLKCTNKWKACGELLCVDHCEFPKDGKGHCFSDPKTDCEQRYDFAVKQNKKEMTVCGSICFLLFILIFYIKFIRGNIHSYDADYWKITIDHNTGHRTLIPHSGNWSHTLIWFHDFNEDTKLAQSFFYEDKFYCNDTKIVLI